MQWIISNDGTLADLYNFFKDHDLQGSILQEAIFDASWRIEQPRIISFVFLPYMLYFIVCNFYFYECMMSEVGRPISMFSGYCDEDQPDCVEKTVEP